MAFLDKVKKALGFKPRVDSEAPARWCTDLLAQIDAGEPLERVARTLRVKWLERSFEQEVVAQRFANQVVPRLKEKYPDGADIADLMLGAFTPQKDAYYTDALRLRAVRLRQQKVWPVEAGLFLSRYHFMQGRMTEGQWFVYRELGGPAGPFLAVELYRRHRLFGAYLHDRVLEEGADSLGRYDAVAAAELACENFQRAKDVAQGLAGRLEPVVGKQVALSIADDLNKTITDNLATAQALVRRKAAEAGPDFAAVARCRFFRADRGKVFEDVKQAVLDARCRQSNALFDPIDRKAQQALLAGFHEHLEQIQAGYGGYLPLLELDAELAELHGDHREAAKQFEHLCRKQAQSGYYPYRAGRALRAAGDPQAARYLIHASRRPGTRWRDEIASARAALAAYEYEGAALREVFPERRAECATKLADWLEEHWKRAGPPHCDMDTAARLALRVAQLRHFAFEQTPAEAQAALAEGVVQAYQRVDLDGSARLRQRAPEDVFDPIGPLDA